MKQPSDYLEDMEKRKRIFQFALEGNTLEAIELTKQLATNLLLKNKDLHFDLLSLHFFELVCFRKCTEALEFAQTKLTSFRKEQKYVEKLEDFLALLAYEEPEKSPMFDLLSLEYRQHVAESLNRAILAHANHPSYTAMERLIQQTMIVRQCLNKENAKELRMYNLIPWNNRMLCCSTRLTFLRKGIRVNEMLKEIRAAIRKCIELNEALELSARS